MVKLRLWMSLLSMDDLAGLCDMSACDVIGLLYMLQFLSTMSTETDCILQFGQVTEKTKEHAGGKALENSLKAYYKEVKKVRLVANLILIFSTVKIIHSLLHIMQHIGDGHKRNFSKIM